MQIARTASLVIALLLCVGCSTFGSSGSGSADGAEFGDGNIPMAKAGEELADVHFEFDSSALSEDARAALKANAEWLNANPSVNVVIEGHCDARGTTDYNYALGDRRARSVYDYLRGLGVQTSQLDTISYGEDVPLDPGNNEEAWAKNRRAHFAVQ